MHEINHWAKKSSTVFGNWPGEYFLSPTRPQKSNVYENT